MNNLVLDRPWRISPWSSRRAEEAIVASGLPPQGSIAGARAFPVHRADWQAHVERVGQERSRVEPLPARIPDLVEEEIIAELTARLMPSFWMAQGCLVSGSTTSIIVRVPHHGQITSLTSGQTYLVRVTQADPAWTEEEAMGTGAVPLPVGLCEMRLSVEEAEKLRDILDNPSYPTHAGKEMPIADASVLLKKTDR